jgi:Tol biopolymer transport system component
MPDYRAHKYGPSFSPDGTAIAFSLLAPGPFHDLYAMNLDGSGLTRITRSPAVDNEVPRWVEDD